MHFAKEGVVSMNGHVDGDGDFVVTANGVPVMFVSACSGYITPLCLSYDEQKYLTKLGFSIADDRVSVCGYAPKEIQGN